MGLLKTVDGGANWKEIARSTFQNQNVARILATALQTQYGDVVLAGTLEGGLFRSPDGGASWPSVGAPNVRAPVTDVVAESSTPSRIYVASAQHVFRSEDGGDTNWTDITPAFWNALPAWATIKMNVSPVADALGKHWIYAVATGIGGAFSLLVSPDLGATWAQLGMPPDNSNPTLPIVASPLRPDAVFCLTDAGSPNHWLAIAPQAQIATQWTQVEAAGANGTGPHTDARDLAFSADPNVLFEVNDGGIYRLINPHGLTIPLFPFLPGIPFPPRRWEEAVGNIRVAEFNSIAYDSVNHVLFGATQDNAIPQQTVPGGTEWGINEDPWGDGFQVGVDTTSTPGAAIHYSSQQSLFHFRRRTYSDPMQVSSDVGLAVIINGTGGLGYNFVEGALTPGDDTDLGSVRWDQSWALNAADPTRILLGTSYLYESFDRGDHFDSLGGLAKNTKGQWIPDKPVGPVSAYAYGHKNNPDVIYVGAGGKLLLRTGSGGLPTVIGATNPGDPNDAGTYSGSSPVDIVMSRENWRRAYVLDDKGRVWRTIDAGSSSSGWADLTGNLGHLSSDLRTIEILPGSFEVGKETVFVGGQGGVFITEHPGTGQFAFWRKHGTNLPNAIVTDIHYSVVDDILVAGTLGRAAWSLNNATDTFAEGPTVSIRSSVKTSCIGGWVEHTTVTFSPTIQGASGLAEPLSYQWALQGGTTTSPLDGAQLSVVMPDAGNTVAVTLTVTDATGYQMFAFTTEDIIAVQIAEWRLALCALVGKLRTEIFRPPPYPQGDPARHAGDVLVAPQTYRQFHEVATQMVGILEHLMRSDRISDRPARKVRGLAGAGRERA